MGISKELEDTEAGFKIVESFPKFRKLPIILTEADPEGCAACSARVYPPNAYRNGTLYPAYEAAAFKSMLQLEDRHKLNLEGILTWAFEFEDQPYFDGFRTLATNGIDKPVLNFFRMAGMLGGDRIEDTERWRCWTGHDADGGRSRASHCRCPSYSLQSWGFGHGVELPG